MIDQRLTKMAEVLVDYSLELKAGDKFLIDTTDLATPLVKEIYRLALPLREPIRKFNCSRGLSHIYLPMHSDEQLQYVSPLREMAFGNYDAFLSIMANYNTKALTNVESSKMALRQRAMAPLNQRFMERAAKGEMRWCVAFIPPMPWPKKASMSLHGMLSLSWRRAF